MAEAVRLVVWDMDETFWRGTLTEGGVSWRSDTLDIVVELARRGIMSSICSKNDFAAVRDVLVANGAWDYFIFPSIDWTPKGARIARLIETVQLRPETVLFIDDNHLNLEEAKFHSPGLQVAPDTVIPTLLADPLLKGKDDGALTRLKQYKVLEVRKADEERARETTGGDNLDFLRKSEIRVRIESDVEAHLDRAIELINRTNQLNFTKRRLPEDIEAARETLRAQLGQFAVQAGLIEVSDRYGDYGFCGYFQVSTRRETAQLQQFCFSCRILDMGVEAWVYQRLGKPSLTIRGEVLSDPASSRAVDWIELAPAAARSAEDAATGDKTLGSVAARGGCILWPLTHYFRLSSPRVIGEFDTIRDGKRIKLDHSLCLRNAMTGATREQIEAVAPLGYVEADFQTEFFDHSGERPLWILSNRADLNSRVYRHNRTGITVPVYKPRTEVEKAVHAPMQAYLDAEFSPVTYGPSDIRQTLAMIYSRLPSHGLLFSLLITEFDRQADGRLIHRPNRQALNRLCTEAAAPHDNVRLLKVADFISDDQEVLNERMTHFDRKVYHRLYLHMLAEAQRDERPAA